MPAKSISLDEAKSDKLFYFVANVVVVRRSDMRCLILKRHPREKVHPERYGVPGGKLEWDDLDLKNPTRLNGDVIDFEDAVEKMLVREAKEEANVTIKSDDLRYINSTAFVRPDGIPVVLVKFAAEYTGGDIKLEEGAFTDYAWVNAEEVKKYTCIEGVEQEVASSIELFS
jgi:8-oxo-dGTP pyrophosphatase MutT (NUDIX family)